MALGKELPVKKRSAKALLPSVFCRVLGKAFTERHKGLRQKKVTGMTVMHRDTFFAERLHSALGKEQNIFFENFFAEHLQDNNAR